ncbi:hypothetical protein [Kribbella sp. C-35]|uniref:hypothetical protein n=1 Tax=Kribbella sp. C-35 TaxID=2789276 RepID=UPI003978A930
MVEYELDADGVHVVGTVYRWQRDYHELTMWSGTFEKFERVKCGTAFTSGPGKDSGDREACSAMETSGRRLGIGLIVLSVGGLIGGSRSRTEHRENQKPTKREPTGSPWDSWPDD